MTATTVSTTRSPARIALYVLQVVLGLFLAVGSGLPKLFGEASAVQIFDQIGAGQWLRYVVGLCEVAGGIGLLVPLVAGLAATCFVALMIGAVTMTLAIGGGALAVIPATVLVLAAVVAWGRRDSTRRLIHDVTGR